MELKDLVGEHLLSGVDTDVVGDANVVMFIIDDITYEAQEDPGDGYRSYLNELIVVSDVVKNTFPPQKVVGKMRDPGYDATDVIDFYNAITDKIILSIGTEDVDDYYPYCVLDWYPENLSINENR